MDKIKMKDIIYKVINLINKKIYIGKTIQELEIRKNQHIKNAFNIKSQKYQSVFYSALRKYGIDKFKWEIIKGNLNESILNINEQFLRNKKLREETLC